MRRVVLPLLGSALITLFSCSGPTEAEQETPTQQQEATLLAPAPVPADECPWASDVDPTCKEGYSEKSCANGTGKCRVSATLGCTCVKNTVAEPAPEPVPVEPVANVVVEPAPVEDKTTKECPWQSDTDPTCKTGHSEASCNNGAGKCRVSGAAGCTCVANSATVEEPVPGPIVAP